MRALKSRMVGQGGGAIANTYYTIPTHFNKVCCYVYRLSTEKVNCAPNSKRVLQFPNMCTVYEVNKQPTINLLVQIQSKI